MSLQPVGVDLTAAGADQFQKAMNAAANIADQLGNTLADKTAPNLDRSITAGVLFGNLLTQAFNTAVGAVKNFVSSGIQAVEGLQDMQVGLETLVSRELLYSGVTDNMTDALARSTPIAEDLMEKIKQLSIQSPFENAQIMAVFRMNMAFGQTSAMSLELTRAITNLGAANKGIPGILERLSYNFSQMSLVGKITGRDIRDLAMAGLDLEKVFGLTLKKSVKEVNEALETGQLTFEEVSKALVEYTDKYIGPAAERASKTLGGLKSTMHDVMFFAAGNLFKDAAENVTSALGGLLEAGMAIVDSRVFKSIGVALDALTEPLQGFGEKLSAMVNQAKNNTAILATIPDNVREQVGQAMAHEDAAFQKFMTDIEAFGDKMMDKALDAFVWGVNIVTQFASGMIQGASDTLVAAMDFIGGILSWFLAPGSPPKVAPNLDAWGAGAFKSYLEGFKDADFSVLDAVQKPLQQALQYALGSDVKAAGAMIDISKLTAKVLAGGADQSELFSLVASKTKMFGSEVAELIEKQFSLSKATEDVRQAEQALLDLRNKETAESQALNKLVAEYNAMITSGASKEALRTKMAEIQAGRAGLFATKAQSAAAQEALVTAQQGLEPLQAQLKAQEAIVKQLTELAAWQKKIDDEAAKRDAGGGAGAAAKKLGTPPAPPMPADNVINKKLEELKNKINEKLKEAFAPVREAWDKEILPAIQRVQDKWEEFTTIWDEFYKKFIEPALSTFKTWWDENDMTTKLGYLVGVILTLNVLWGVMTWALGLLSPVVAIFTGVINAAKFAVAGFNLIMALGLGPILLIAAGVAFLAYAWTTNMGGVRTNIEMFGKILGLLWDTKVKPFFEDVKTRVLSFKEHWEKAFSKVQELMGTAQGKAELFKAGVQIAFELVWGAIQQFISPIAAVFDGISAAINTVIGWVQNFIDSLKKLKLPDWLTPGSPTPFEMGLVGISDEMEHLSRVDIPKLERSMVGLQAGAGLTAGMGRYNNTGASVTQNYSYTLNQNNMPGAPNRSLAGDMRTIQMVSKLTTPRYRRSSY